jgi:hypothetical protein
MKKVKLFTNWFYIILILIIFFIVVIINYNYKNVKEDINCDPISNVTIRDSCFQKLAVSLNDVNICNNLSLFDIGFRGPSQADCVRFIIYNTTNISQCYQLSNKKLREICYGEYIVFKHSEDDCEKIEPDFINSKGECYLIEAIAKNDSNLCQKIEPSAVYALYGRPTKDYCSYYFKYSYLQK